MIAGQRFTQGFDNRNTARNGGFEVQRNIIFFCQGNQSAAMFGEQCFICGDNMFAAFQRRFDSRFRHTIGAANQFNETIDLG